MLLTLDFAASLPSQELWKHSVFRNLLLFCQKWDAKSESSKLVMLCKTKLNATTSLNSLRRKAIFYITGTIFNHDFLNRKYLFSPVNAKVSLYEMCGIIVCRVCGCSFKIHVVCRVHCKEQCVEFIAIKSSPCFISHSLLSHMDWTTPALHSYLCNILYIYCT